MNGLQPEIKITGEGMYVQVFKNGEPEWRPVLSVTQRPGFMGVVDSEYNPVISDSERVLRSDTGAIHIVVVQP